MSGCGVPASTLCSILSWFLAQRWLYVLLFLGACTQPWWNLHRRQTFFCQTAPQSWAKQFQKLTLGNSFGYLSILLCLQYLVEVAIRTFSCSSFIFSLDPSRSSPSRSFAWKELPHKRLHPPIFVVKLALFVFTLRACSTWNQNWLCF